MGCGTTATLYPSLSKTLAITAAPKEGWSIKASPVKSTTSTFFQPSVSSSLTLVGNCALILSIENYILSGSLIPRISIPLTSTFEISSIIRSLNCFILVSGSLRIVTS